MLALLACGGGTRSAPADERGAAAEVERATVPGICAADAGVEGAVAAAGAAPECDVPVPIFERGREIGHVCPAEALREGLTIVDLSDDWVPWALREPDDYVRLPQPYRATYVALANEELPAGAEGERPRRDAFLELYGIFPSFRVLAARLLDEERHRCHAAIDQSAIQALATSPQPATAHVAPAVTAAFAALDQRLVCERLLPESARRRPRWRLQEALEAYQQKQTIVSYGVLDRETRRALAQDSRELDFRALLRTLRARVTDAAGLIEDGTALASPGTILSRRVDGDAFYAPDGHDALEEGAPDLVSPATEAAARALGWTDPDAAADFFLRRGPDPSRRLTVALRLPPVPAYHAGRMDLRVEIDRGDVWYELPTRRGRIAQRPTLTLYARTSGEEEVALIRWPTTIGGWKKELGPRGKLGLRYKNSEVGKRLWRDLVVSPAWLPPPRTPPRALVRRQSGPVRWLPDTSLVGPGYASAYGLVMLVHHRAVEDATGTLWYDNGIRTHGSVNYHSILRSESHGCHRLFNHAAVQLASFLLQHRPHVTHGLIAKPFTHEFTWRGMKVKLPIPQRGYRFELTPPVDVEVLQGTVRGKLRRVPLRIVRIPRAKPPPRATDAAAQASVLPAENPSEARSATGSKGAASVLSQTLTE
ncbi:MAG TPA: hypothetical protein VF904_01030 [Anaeromyxobacteraceae bacterium]